jgi:hypothetical protein
LIANLQENLVRTKHKTEGEAHRRPRRRMAAVSKLLRGSARLVRNGLAAVGVCTVGYLTYEYKNAGFSTAAGDDNDTDDNGNANNNKKRVLVIPLTN